MTVTIRDNDVRRAILRAIRGTLAEIIAVLILLMHNNNISNKEILYLSLLVGLILGADKWIRGELKR